MQRSHAPQAQTWLEKNPPDRSLSLWLFEKYAIAEMTRKNATANITTAENSVQPARPPGAACVDIPCSFLGCLTACMTGRRQEMSGVARVHPGECAAADPPPRDDPVKMAAQVGGGAADHDHLSPG